MEFQIQPQINEALLPASQEFKPQWYRLVLRFIDSLEERKEAFEHAHAQNDLKSIQKLAHNLSTAAMYGYPILTASSQKLDFCAAMGQKEETAEELKIIFDILQRIQAGAVYLRALAE